MRTTTLGAFLAFAFTVTVSAQGIGIFVGEPKIYDDRSLQLMLNAARAQLGALRPLDQASLLGSLANVQGANLRQTQFSLQVNGPPTTGNVTTTTSGTPSPVVTNNTTTTTGTSPSTSVENQTVTTTPGSTMQNVATQPSVTPTIPTLPAPTTSLPSTFGLSPLDTLNEQMQLTYEIANIQLLLEGALSDRFVRGTHLLKRHTTVGFPISIATPADKLFQNAVAEVEVTVSNGPVADPNAGPALLTILPREKTYNIANITDRSVSIGGGIVASVASVGASWLWGHKTYYLVQDQDTLALQREATNGQTRFAWQFRPVLGQKVLKSGLRQTFVQLAFGTGPARPGCLGFVQIVTRWRRYDPKTGAVGAEIIASTAQTYPLANFDLTPQADSVTIEDVGGGTVTVSVAGSFLVGTRVRLGSTYLDESMSNFVSTPSGIQFTVPAAMVAATAPKLVSRDGTEHGIFEQDSQVGDIVSELPKCTQQPPSPIPAPAPPTAGLGRVRVDPEARISLRTVSAQIAPNSVPPPADSAPTGSACPQAIGAENAASQVVICRVSVDPYTDTQSLVTIILKKSPPDPARRNPLVVLIGSKLFGLSDTPFLAATRYGIRFIAANDLLRSSRSVIVKRMFWGPNFADQTPLPLFADYAIAKLSLLSVVGDETLFAVSGARADQVEVVVPESDVRSKTLDTTTKLLFVKTARLKDLKQFVLQVDKQPPVILAVPDDAKPAPPKPSLKPHDSIPPAANVSFTISGAGLDTVKRINYLKTVIPFVVALDKQSIAMTLPPEVTTTEGIRYLDVLFTDGTSSRYEIDVKTKK
jgi:hypothetical protein